MATTTETLARLEAAEGILRKLLDVENGYADVRGGVFDTRVDLTDAEIALLERLDAGVEPKAATTLSGLTEWPFTIRLADGRTVSGIAPEDPGRWSLVVSSGSNGDVTVFQRDQLLAKVATGSPS